MRNVFIIALLLVSAAAYSQTNWFVEDYEGIMTGEDTGILRVAERRTKNS